MLPFVVFVSLSVISVTTGSSWGLYAVAIPLVVPLAQQLGSDVLLNCGAVISAVFLVPMLFVFRCYHPHRAEYECNNLDHGLSQLPYAGISFALSAGLFVFWLFDVGFLL
jgi:Na+/H+ antiporter NhaC